LGLGNISYPYPRALPFYIFYFYPGLAFGTRFHFDKAALQFIVVVPDRHGGFRFGPDMSTSGLLPFKMASEKKIEEPGV
jgi:hypothetical protein